LLVAVLAAGMSLAAVAVRAATLLALQPQMLVQQ
jgi:hypothetical protein